MRALEQVVKLPVTLFAAFTLIRAKRQKKKRKNTEKHSRIRQSKVAYLYWFSNVFNKSFCKYTNSNTVTFGLESLAQHK